MANPVALITGVNGQDGSYLSELLLGKGYIVVGVVRRASTNNTERLSSLLSNPAFLLVEGDISDPVSCIDLIEKYKPTEVYNLAAQSHVGTSFQQPIATWNINAIGVQHVLEAIRKVKPDAKFYQASTSEMFGSVIDADGFQRETTELSPNSPYAVAKVAAHHTTRLYREAYGLHASSGILFNHESPRRGELFVTRKITKYIANFSKAMMANRAHAILATDPTDTNLKFKTASGVGQYPKLRLGNIDAKRDWGFAGDYVEAMWLMLQQDKADDFVIATGETHSVKDFLYEAFEAAVYPGDTWENVVFIDPEFVRPYEVPVLCGDSSKARRVLGWEPRTNFSQLVKLMVDNERV